MRMTVGDSPWCFGCGGVLPAFYDANRRRLGVGGLHRLCCCGAAANVWQLRSCCSGTNPDQSDGDYRVFTSSDLSSFGDQCATPGSCTPSHILWDGRCWALEWVVNSDYPLIAVDPANVSSVTGCSDASCPNCCNPCSACCLGEDALTADIPVLPKLSVGTGACSCQNELDSTTDFLAVFEDQIHVLQRGPATLCGGSINIGDQQYYIALSSSNGCCYIRLECDNGEPTLNMVCQDWDWTDCDGNSNTGATSGFLKINGVTGQSDTCTPPKAFDETFGSGGGSLGCFEDSGSGGASGVGTLDWSDCGWGCDFDGNCSCGKCGTEVTCGECDNEFDDASCSPI